MRNIVKHAVALRGGRETIRPGKDIHWACISKLGHLIFFFLNEYWIVIPGDIHTKEFALATTNPLPVTVNTTGFSVCLKVSAMIDLNLSKHFQ